MRLGSIPNACTISAAREEKETSFSPADLSAVAGQKITSASCNARRPFTVISSGSPGPKETNRIKSTILSFYQHISRMIVINSPPNCSASAIVCASE